MVFCIFASCVLLPFFLNGKGSALLPRREYYLLCFYEGKDALRAREAAEALSLRGGAGTVREEGRSYCVYACAYEGYTDAVRVAESIRAAGGSCTVRALILPAASAESEQRRNAILLSEEGFRACFSAFTAAYKDAEGGKDTALILSAVAACREGVYAARQKLTGEGALVLQARELLGDCIRQCEELIRESSASALSVQAKRKQLALLFAYRDFLCSAP